MGGTEEEPGLAEVKAVLRKMQRLDLAADQSFDPVAVAKGAAAVEAGLSNRAGMGVFDRKFAAISKKDSNTIPQRRLLYLMVAALIAVCAAIIPFATGVVTFPRPSPVSGPKPPSQAERLKKVQSILAEARRNLSEGEIKLARTQLLKAEPERLADVAFTLAQSYDPNFLQSLPHADAAADRPEAERWYKKWYELAVQTGLEMDSGRLQRIINAMR